MNNREIRELLRERILVLDGGFGSLVQTYNLTEPDFRGGEFADWRIPLTGCFDILTLTRPDVIASIHEAYFAAGADIVSTDTFNASAVSLADYGLQEFSYRFNRAGAEIARKVADRFEAAEPGRPRFVAGSVGPTSKTASMSAEVTDPASRDVTFDELAEAYTVQMRGLVDGGCDVILIETIFDTLNAKAAIFAHRTVCRESGRDIPVMLSGTLADASGRTLSGQTVEAFYTSVAHAHPISVGFNCAYGAKQLMPYLERLSAVSEFPVSAHPNAGLPNVMGGYDETPEMMAADVEQYMLRGLVNIIGGCCGTTPDHIRLLAEKARMHKPRTIPRQRHETVLSGLEPLRITKETNFVNVGERTNVAGSAKFARLIREGNFEEAVGIARQQVEAGAQVVDVCMDDGLIDGPQAMTSFLNLAMSEPEIARVPFMIDSSSWETLEAGLKCVQGKSLVNSISLKEGETEFLRKARAIRDYGAAAVVMLFDETGQADTFARKIEVAGRAYNILTGDGFPPEDIVFDPNVLSVATGIEEHNGYGVDFIEAVRWIKQNLPYAKTSGGVSNLSFSFRGNNKVREAMHSVFLYHAIRAGLDMGIVNPAMLQVYSEIEPELLELTEDVVLNRRPDATERLAENAEKIKGDPAAVQITAQGQQWREGDLHSRIAWAMKKGITDFTEQDILDAYAAAGSALGVIDGYLMPVMDEIGVLFGEGKMFLPQVVKSARVMKRSVDVLTPYIEGGGAQRSNAGKVLIATVKGDVHDIGKNIVSVVMSCNGYEVKDLGVMVESHVIVEQARSWGADVVGLSGLISPSLGEMIRVVKELRDAGLDVPVVIGGATTSELHTAVKIAPEYGGVVIHSRDASENITILSRLIGDGGEEYKRAVKERQAALRESYGGGRKESGQLSLDKARANGYRPKEYGIPVPRFTGIRRFDAYPVAKAARYIDWNYFFPAWGLKGKYPAILDDAEKGEEARKLLKDAREMLDRIDRQGLLRLQGAVGIFPAYRDGDNIVVEKPDGSLAVLPQLRNQETKGVSQQVPAHKPGCPCCNGTVKAPGGLNLSLADLLPGKEEGGGYIGAFALTSGIGLDKLAGRYRLQRDEYSAIMAKLLADRLAEAFAEAVHTDVRKDMWAYETGNPQPVEEVLANRYEGLRVALGYPSVPDHSLKSEVLDLLGGDLPLTLTENYMLDPGESVCGLIFARRDFGHFSVGRIGPDQLEDYARRRGMDPTEITRLMQQHVLE
ncbi:MAG: methionine synthase [Rikenellaceae bacterium]|nr:methionine synthase [Rikenellaceae bacterium]